MFIIITQEEKTKIFENKIKPTLHDIRLNQLRIAQKAFI